jgi:hypothetical protein
MLEVLDIRDNKNCHYISAESFGQRDIWSNNIFFWKEGSSFGDKMGDSFVRWKSKR